MAERWSGKKISSWFIQNECDLVLVELGHKLGKVQQAAAESVDLVDHHAIDPAGLDVGQAALRIGYQQQVDALALQAVVVVQPVSVDEVDVALAVLGDGLLGAVLGWVRMVVVSAGAALMHGAYKAPWAAAGFPDGLRSYVTATDSSNSIGLR